MPFAAHFSSRTTTAAITINNTNKKKTEGIKKKVTRAAFNWNGRPLQSRVI